MILAFSKIFSHLSSDVFVPRIPDVPTPLRWMFLEKEDKLQNLTKTKITLAEIQAVYPSCFWPIVSLMPKAPSWVGRRWAGRRSRKRTRLLEGRWNEVMWNWRGGEVRKRSRSWLWRSRSRRRWRILNLRCFQVLRLQTIPPQDLLFHPLSLLHFPEILEIVQRLRSSRGLCLHWPPH